MRVLWVASVVDGNAGGNCPAAHDGAHRALDAGGPVAEVGDAEVGDATRLVALAGANAKRGAAPLARGPGPLEPLLAGVAIVYGACSGADRRVPMASRWPPRKRSYRSSGRSWRHHMDSRARVCA